MAAAFCMSALPRISLHKQNAHLLPFVNSFSVLHAKPLVGKVEASPCNHGDVHDSLEYAKSFVTCGTKEDDTVHHNCN